MKSTVEHDSMKLVKYKDKEYYVEEFQDFITGEKTFEAASVDVNIHAYGITPELALERCHKAALENE